MKVKEMINETQKQEVCGALHEMGFISAYNKYAPFSVFYTKALKGKKTLYVRSDIDTKYGKHYYEFEAWVRDNKKGIFDKTLDTRVGFVSRNADLLLFVSKVKEAAV